jgi:hypothetical protein
MKKGLSSWALAAALVLPGGTLVACGEAKQAVNDAGNKVEKEAEEAGKKIKKEADKAKDKATDSDGGNQGY